MIKLSQLTSSRTVMKRDQNFHQWCVIGSTAVEARLVAEGVQPDVARRLTDFVQHGDDFSVSRISPYVLADNWGAPRRAVLEACLRATRAGLLDLRWDLLCPLCRGPQESESSLSEISSKVHCETCRIDFTVNFDRFVEITFRPNASVRTADVKNYCMGSPQRTPHVVAQQLLAGAHQSLGLCCRWKKVGTGCASLELARRAVVNY